MSDKNNRFTEYGWDKHSLFYPTSKTQIFLLVGFMTLVVLHFSEIIGFADTDKLIYGFFPVPDFVVFIYLSSLNSSTKSSVKGLPSISSGIGRPYI